MSSAHHEKSQAQLYVLTGEGSAEVTPLSRLNTLIAQEKTLWLVTPFESARDILKDVLSVSSLVLNSLCVKESRPRALLLSDDSLLLNLRAVNVEGDPEDMISIRSWANARMLITVYRTEARAIKEMERNLLMNQGPKTIDECLVQLLEKTLDHISEVTCLLDSEVDILEDKIANQTWKVTRSQLSALRQRVVSLRRYLVPERDAVSRLQVTKIDWISEVNMVRLREINNELLRLLDDVDSAKERTTMLYEELFNIGQEKINQKIFILSMLALIFMPMTFLTGLLGVNVAGIPLAHTPHGFLMVCYILLIIFLVELVVLMKLKWLTIFKKMTLK